MIPSPYSLLPVFPNSTIPQFHNSTFLPDSRLTTHGPYQFHNSTVPQFHNSTFLPDSLSFPTQQLNNSPTQHSFPGCPSQFHNSTIPQFHNSTFLPDSRYLPERELNMGKRGNKKKKACRGTPFKKLVKESLFQCRF